MNPHYSSSALSFTSDYFCLNRDKFGRKHRETSNFKLSQNKPYQIPLPLLAIVFSFKSIPLQQSYGRNIIGRRESSDRFQLQHLESIMKNRGEGFLHNALKLIERMKFVPNFRSSLIA